MFPSLMQQTFHQHVNIILSKDRVHTLTYIIITYPIGID
jgi:hypothetical protein